MSDHQELTPEEGELEADALLNEDEASAEELEDNDVLPEDVESLTAALQEAKARADENWEMVLRSRAELDNQTRRQQTELDKALKFALDSFVKELLQVWDSLELGVQAAQDESANVSTLREGSELTLKLLTGALNKHGVEQIDPEGEAFNPELHQAMSMQPRDDVPPNTVVGVVQKGYSLNGRLVRPAMVMVSQAG